MDDDTIDINLRSGRAVAHRLLALIALANRVAIEEVGESGLDHEEESFDLVAWLIDADAFGELTDDERSFLESRLGGTSPDEASEYALALESAFALAWALALIDIAPSPPLPFEVGTFLEVVPSPAEPAQPFTTRDALRPLEEIALQRELADLWFWRLDIERERREEARRGISDLQDQIDDVIVEAREADHPIELIDGDFALGGRSLRRLPADEVSYAASLALGRLLALNWLCGYGESWDMVPIEI